MVYKDKVTQKLSDLWNLFISRQWDDGTFSTDPLTHIRVMSRLHPLASPILSGTIASFAPCIFRNQWAEISLILKENYPKGSNRLIRWNGQLFRISEDLEIQRCWYNFTDPYYSHAVWGTAGTARIFIRIGALAPCRTCGIGRLRSGLRDLFRSGSRNCISTGN